MSIALSPQSLLQLSPKGQSIMLARRHVFASATEEVWVGHSVPILIGHTTPCPAGQSGLVGALASAYIDWSREYDGESQDYLVCTALCVLGQDCFDLSLEIDWVTGDTTESINYLTTGDADIAITYNAAAENRAMKLSVATKRVYGFRDHFYLVGPM